MKADPHGGPVDQFAARIGYLQPAQRRQAEKPADQTCSSCDKSASELYTNSWGGRSYRLRCGHPAAPGEMGCVTKENAVCDCWTRKPVELPGDRIRAAINMRYPR